MLPDTVVCFDRDWTISVFPKPGYEMVPLNWVKYLAHSRDDVHVWATGNQKLCDEASIPGKKQAKQAWYEFHYDYELTLEEIEEPLPERRRGLRQVKDIYTKSTEGVEFDFVVIDDVNLEDLEDEGWSYYKPWDFVEAVNNNNAEVHIPDDTGFCDERMNDIYCGCGEFPIAEYHRPAKTTG